LDGRGESHFHISNPGGVSNTITLEGIFRVVGIPNLNQFHAARIRRARNNDDSSNLPTGHDKRESTLFIGDNFVRNEITRPFIIDPNPHDRAGHGFAIIENDPCYVRFWFLGQLWDLGLDSLFPLRRASILSPSVRAETAQNQGGK
jgi:hypothetical protein